MEVSQNLPKCLQLPVQLNSWPAGAGLGKISPEKMMVGNRMQGKWLSTSSCRVSALERLRVTLLQQQPKHPQICQPAAKQKVILLKAQGNVQCLLSVLGLQITEHSAPPRSKHTPCMNHGVVLLISHLPSSFQKNPWPVYKPNSLHKLSSVKNVAQRFPKKKKIYIGKVEISTGKTWNRQNHF